jgi:hypothetical protein
VIGPYDAIVSYHTDTQACGTAKFNALLAARLGVPVVTLAEARACQCPLYSIRGEEMAADGVRRVDPIAPTFGVFVHDWVEGLTDRLVHAATTVYAANATLMRRASHLRADVVPVWCPSTITPTHLDQAPRAILTFGMLHKFDADRYRRLKDLLDADGDPYELLVSYSVHHGQPADERQLIEQFEDVFGSGYHDAGRARVTVLGQLSDTALIRELPRVVAVAVFYDPAVRANNTTAWMALEWGRCLITNLDADSPAAFVHGTTVYDVNRLDVWPTDKARVAQAARRVAADHSWDRLVERLCIATASAAAIAAVGPR